MICHRGALTQGYIVTCPLAIYCQPALASLSFKSVVSPALASLRFSRQRYNLPSPLWGSQGKGIIDPRRRSLNFIRYHRRPSGQRPSGQRYHWFRWDINEFYRISSIPVGRSLIFIRHHYSRWDIIDPVRISMIFIGYLQSPLGYHWFSSDIINSRWDIIDVWISLIPLGYQWFLSDIINSRWDIIDFHPT